MVELAMICCGPTFKMLKSVDVNEMLSLAIKLDVTSYNLTFNTTGTTPVCSKYPRKKFSSIPHKALLNFGK